MSNKRVFISFAIEDEYARDFLVQQGKDKRSPFEFTDMSVKEPWDSSWKTKCRERIKSCDAVIALISKKTWNADGAKWEMQCADEEGVPMLGVHIHKDDKGSVPAELDGYKVIEWSWDGIANFINSL
ncbi:MAG TPA: TIR domain-containing protein [Candidatus Bathyarchaeia archaeon]|nr:TIR domain-containing protein [Candidatus Bathyarchaeia archaeon]